MELSDEQVRESLRDALHEIEADGTRPAWWAYAFQQAIVRFGICECGLCCEGHIGWFLRREHVDVSLGPNAKFCPACGRRLVVKEVPHAEPGTPEQYNATMGAAAAKGIRLRHG